MWYFNFIIKYIDIGINDTKKLALISNLVLPNIENADCKIADDDMIAYKTEIYLKLSSLYLSEKYIRK